jgi:hypothetical protein
MADDARPGNPVSRTLRGIAALNLDALRVFFTSGAGSAAKYVTYTHRMYTGYGLPWMWSGLPWRSDLTVPQGD